MAASGTATNDSKKRKRVAPDYVMAITVGPRGERTQTPHFLTDRCDCMPGVRVPDDVAHSCQGSRRVQNWRYLQGYCSKGGRFRDGCEPVSSSSSTTHGCGALQRSEGKLRTDVLRPCKYHTDMLANFRNYIEISETSVQNRQTLQDEIDVLNQAIKDGLGEHCSRREYTQIPHHNELEDETDETQHEREVRELQDQLFDARLELIEMRRAPTTRDVGTQTDPVPGS
jgi:hypothetical protein